LNYDYQDIIKNKMSFRETSAFFITNQCLFGSYPTQTQVNELEEWGIDIIVNLTKLGEKKVEPYITNKKVINFEITDNSIPVSEKILEFCSLVIYLVKMINDCKKIYIHCKGGHGRSGILVACILCYKYNVTVPESLKITNKCHLTRPIHARRPQMNDYWISKGSPQTEEQKKFVQDIFWPYRVNRSPFNNSEWSSDKKGKIDNILKKTNIGPIFGVNGKIDIVMQKYRDELIEGLFIW